MKAWLKRHLVPHEGNDHRPHLLHGDTARGIIVMVLFLEVLVFFSSVAIFTQGKFMAAVLPAVLDDLTNVERSNTGLGTLADNPVLDQAATLKAQDMAAKGYFAHTSPEGKTPWYWLDQVGYDYEYAGENLAINFTDSKDVTAAWMNSPTHKANIEKAQYTEIGTGVATGTYQGNVTIFVAQVYAKPASKAVAVVRSITEPEKKVVPVAVAETVTNETPTSTQVLGVEEVDPVQTISQGRPSLWQRLMASPRHTMNIVLFVLGALIAVVIGLKLSISMKVRHIDLVANGLLVLAVLGAVYLGNLYLSHRGLNVAQATSFEEIQR